MNQRRNPLFLGMLAVLVMLPATVTAQVPHSHQHRFHDAQKWAKVFDDPQRDAWQMPQEVIRALSLAPDAVVADIGAGTGYFSARFARVLPNGRVYAVDTEPDMVRYLGERAKREGVRNLIPVAATPTDARLPDRADLIILVDVYHHVDARESYFRKLQESLRPGGRVAVIDFRLESPYGPPKSARIAPEVVKKELAAAGYALVEEHGFLPNQYFLVFRPGKG